MIYLVWSLFVLGIIPYGGPYGILENYTQQNEATVALAQVLGSSAMSYFASLFAFFAIVTSFLAQGLTLAHFLADGFHVNPQKKSVMRWIVPLVFAPPLLFAWGYPKIFLQALSFAGGLCAMILFGVLPVVVVWIGRYRQRIASSYRLCGGKPLLVLAFLFSVTIIFCELKRLFSV